MQSVYEPTPAVHKFTHRKISDAEMHSESIVKGEWSYRNLSMEIGTFQVYSILYSLLYITHVSY